MRKLKVWNKAHGKWEDNRVCHKCIDTGNISITVNYVSQTQHLARAGEL